jgi:hypothetical protein
MRGKTKASRGTLKPATKQATKKKATKKKAGKQRPSSKRAPQATSGGLSYVFRNRRTLTARKLEQIDPVHREQFLNAIQLYNGTLYPSVKEAIEGVVKMYDGDPSVFSIDLWDIVRADEKQPLFEYWVQSAGDGTVFAFGERDSSDVSSTQHSFQSHGDDDEKTRLLVQALQSAASKAGL